MNQTVIDTAKKYIGFVEGVNNKNPFAKIAGHTDHQAWCVSFIVAVFIEAGAEKAIPNTASCIQFEQWANARSRGIPLSEAKTGDLLLFDFSRSGKSEHIGLAVSAFNSKTRTIRTIEGNTSSGKGSQTNGDGVYSKIRSSSSIRMVVRPRWEKYENISKS